MNRLCSLLGIRYPILQGAMTLVTDVGLVSAVSNAGGLGIYAGGIDHIDLEKTRRIIRELKQRTSQPFGFNIVLSSPAAPDLVELVCAERVPVVTTGAGNPGRFMAQFKAADILVGPVVPSVKVARKMEAAGADFLVAEGMESGGYIGSASTMALVPQVADAVRVPVVAAGGIADGRGLAAALMLGASGVQMGTRFLATTECSISKTYKEAVVKAQLTDAMVLGEKIGTPMRNRTLRNEAATQLQAYENSAHAQLEEYNLRFAKARNAFGGPLEDVLLGLGQGVGLVDEVLDVQAVIEGIVKQYNQLGKEPI